MSESLPQQIHEQGNTLPETHPAAVDHREHRPSSSSEFDHSEAELAEARSMIEAHAVSASELSKPDEPPIYTESHPPIGLQQELKEDAYKRTIGRIQNKLTGPDRRFSKIVHNPTVERASNIAAQSVGRPIGLLGGALFSLVGSAVFLYITRHFGYAYNYGVILFLFVIGYIAATMLEGIRAAIRRGKQ